MSCLDNQSSERSDRSVLSLPAIRYDDCFHACWHRPQHITYNLSPYMPPRGWQELFQGSSDRLIAFDIIKVWSERIYRLFEVELKVLNWIEIRRVWRPLEHKRYAVFFEPSLRLLAGMNRRIILYEDELVAAIVLDNWQQSFVEGVAIRCC